MLRPNKHSFTVHHPTLVFSIVIVGPFVSGQLGRGWEPPLAAGEITTKRLLAGMEHLVGLGTNRG